MQNLEKRNPGWRVGASGATPSREIFHVQNPTAEPLLQRLERVQKAGQGWRARCPACGGSSQKLTVTERDGRVLLHCFGGCKAIDVLVAVGLGWPDIMPPRHWPDSPEERRQAQRAMREAGLISAISVLALEANIVLMAARQLTSWQPLSGEDDTRLATAVERIERATNLMVEVRR